VIPNPFPPAFRGAVLVVRASWSGFPLGYWYLDPPREFMVGDDPAVCDFVLPSDKLASERAVVASVSDAGVAVPLAVGTDDVLAARSSPPPNVPEFDQCALESARGRFPRQNPPAPYSIRVPLVFKWTSSSTGSGY
jgi:hypothetical protein